MAEETRTEATNKETPAKLTINDPVDPETLKKFSDLREARMQIADNLINLENEKVRMMVAVRQIDNEKNRLFEKIIVERGLPIGFPVNIDGNTGAIKPLMDMPDVAPPGPAKPDQPPTT